MAKTGGTCVICGYEFKPKDGKYWKQATICDKCYDKLYTQTQEYIKQDKENGL